MLQTTNLNTALQIGEINGLEAALQLAELSRQESNDIDYFIEALRSVVKSKHDE